jgi:hypothetical protein
MLIGNERVFKKEEEEEEEEEKKKDKAFQSISPHTKKFPLKSSKNISFFDKRNIIKNAKRSQVHSEYARGASKTEKKKVMKANH